LFIYSLPEALIHSTTFPDGIEPVFLIYSIPIPRFQAGRRMRLSTNSWRRVCKHMSRAKQNRKDYRSQLYIRPKPRATDGSREEPIERLRKSKLWGLKENFSLQFHQLLAKSHPMRMSSSLDNVINICKRFKKSQARLCDPEPKGSNSKLSERI